MFDWAIPWTPDDVIDFIFLAAATIIVIAVPLVYGARANLRDPLARAVLIGTGATGVAFLAAVIFTVATHAGWTPPAQVQHWIARGLYFTVGFGKLILLMALISALREGSREPTRFQKRVDEASP